MAVPASPATAVTGPLAASLLNAYKSNVDFLIQNSGTRPYCHAYQNTGQAVSGGVGTNVTLDSEVKDTDGMHTGSNSFFTVQTAGLYLVVAGIALPNTTGGTDKISILQNAATAITTQVPFQSVSHRLNCSGFLQCAATDTIGLNVTPGSAVTLQTGQTATFLQAFWMSL